MLTHQHPFRCASGSGLTELLKDPFPVFLGNSDSCIGHGNDHLLAVGPGRERNAAPLGSELDRIGQQVVHNLTQFAGVLAKQRNGVIQVAVQV